MHIIYMMIYLNVSAHSTFKVNNNKRTKLKLLGGEGGGGGGGRGTTQTSILG